MNPNECSVKLNRWIPGSNLWKNEAIIQSTNTKLAGSMQEWSNGLVRQWSADIVNQGSKATWIVESMSQWTCSKQPMIQNQCVGETEPMTQWIHGSWINKSIKQWSRINQPTEQYNQAQRSKESMNLWSTDALNPIQRTNVSMSQIN